MSVLITGSAGFIGFHTAKRFLSLGHQVIGYDGFTDYYDTELKRNRDGVLRLNPNFVPVEGLLEDAALLSATIEKYKPGIVVHLAAQAGVRYSIEKPEVYVSSNIQGTFNLLEALRYNRPQHLLIASTSSVYGANRDIPFRETAATRYPVSFYASTKLACEAMSHAYSALYEIPTTCFRFFTVYGPWGRPDMALFKFVRNINAGEPIEVYGNGQMYRDFTYIDDLVQSIELLSKRDPHSDAIDLDCDTKSEVAPWRVVNIGAGKPYRLMDFVKTIEDAIGKRATYKFLPMQDGDVVATYADTELHDALLHELDRTPLDVGIAKFISWFDEYFG